MSDEKALLAAIWKHPHEDTARLVFADWLQENGHPERAEFIRVQCELARLDEWDEGRRPALEKREKKLLKQFEKDWRKNLPAELREAPFRRGFVAPRERRCTRGSSARCPRPRSPRPRPGITTSKALRTGFPNWRGALTCGASSG